MNQKLYFSDFPKDNIWECGDVAYLFYVPKKWWSIKQWKLVNGFKKNISAILMNIPDKDFYKGEDKK
jgi:hypothetical protein